MIRSGMAGILMAAAVVPGVGAAAPVRTDNLVEKRIVLQRFAACVVRNAAGASARFLKTEPGSRDEHDRVGWLVLGQRACVGDRSGLSMQPWAIRGAIAEAMFERDPALLQTAAKLPDTPAVRVGTGLKVEPFMVAYATCLVGASPGAATAVLRTQQGTEEERAAIVKLNLTACMATDVAYHLDFGDLRTHLASAVYLVARPGSAGA